MKTPTQAQRAIYWKAICMLFKGGEPALIKALHDIANTAQLMPKRKAVRDEF